MPKRGGKRNPSGFLNQHKFALKNALKAIRTNPWAVAINCAILGISISLAVGLYLGVNFLLLQHNSDETTLFVYLDFIADTPSSVQEELQKDITNNPLVKRVERFSGKQIFADLKLRLALPNQSDLVSANPFADTLVVEFASQASQRLTIEKILAAWQHNERVVSLSRYSRKQQSGAVPLAVYTRALLIVIPVLILGIALMCGNMVRNQLLRQRLEIEITRYCGGDPKFLRRPFLYWGCIQALLGALTALIIITLAWWLLNSPMDLSFEHANTTIKHPPLSAALCTISLIASGILGLASAWITTKFHLGADIDA